MFMGDTMIFQTHVQIANIVISMLDQQDIDLMSRQEFIKGSNHPDYDFTYRKLKHQLSHSFPTVYTLMQDVTEKPMSRYELGFQCGIIAHFLADYMCSYHSNPFYNRINLATHIMYEQSLHEKTKHIQALDTLIFHAQSLQLFNETMFDFIHTHMQDKDIDPVRDFYNALSLVYQFIRLTLDIRLQKTPTHYPSDTRVAIFTDTYYPHINGVSNTIFHYINYLKKEHIPYVLISPLYKSSMKDKEMGYDIIRLKAIPFLFYKETMVAIPNKKQTYTLLDEFKPTVIQLMTEFTIGHMGLNYGKSRDIKVVSNYSTHFMSYVKYLGLGFLYRPLKRYIKGFHNKASVTTCPSKDTEAYLLNIGITRTRVFGRGIHTDQFSKDFRSDAFRETYGINPFIYLYVGRLSAEKSLELALEAFEPIALKHPHAQFLVVGNGPKYDTWKKEFPGVHFLGYKTGHELSMIYASADAFIFPSSTETLGNVVLEAMASGLPVVVANKGGVLENVTHRINGLIAPTQDHTSYQMHMESLISDSTLYALIQKEALMYVKSKSWSDIFKEHIKSYAL